MNHMIRGVFFTPTRIAAFVGRGGLSSLALSTPALVAWSVAALSVVALAFASVAHAQEAEDAFEANYDEAKVPRYTLPDPLRFSDGAAVRSEEDWQKRRSEILRLFQEHVYGEAPGRPGSMWFETVETSPDALGGKATRTQVKIHLKKGSAMEDISLLVYLPNEAQAPVPTFLGLNFYGNHTIYPDSSIRLADEWVRNNEDFGITGNRVTESSRGVRNSRWPVERIIERGYGLATAYYGDIDPDRPGNFQDGVHPLFYENGQSKPGPGEWGAIGAWAWGLSRIMDYFEQSASSVDQDCVALMGHSRIGKAALWAGARDERFALVISNDSGAGGAALSRRRFGETVGKINASFPHWFAGNFNKYSENERALPVDQHMLISLMAPRPVYVASAQEDRWADPRGEFLAAKGAEPVYRMLGAGGLDAEEWPDSGEAVMSQIGYHLRPGAHDVKAYDWEQFMNFADRHLPCRE